jgi:hypothetical protein
MNFNKLDHFSLFNRKELHNIGRNLELLTIVQHSDIADAFSFQKRRIQMIMPNATSVDTLGPRKAFTIITKDSFF